MQLDLYSPLPIASQLQPLSRFLTQRKVFITIDDATEYKRCRVQSNRKGIVLRDLAKGAAINTKKQQVCRPGDFIVAEIDAKVGGYGFIPGALDGAIVSSHYYLFEIDEHQLLPRYLYYLTQSDIIQSQITSQGSTNYAAIRPKEFLAIEIPYIEPAQQREIVVRLDAITQEAEAFNKESAHQSILLARLRQAVLREAVQGRLVPQEATDEPAPAVLARIRAEKQRLVKEKKLSAAKPLSPLSEAEVPEGWAWCRIEDACYSITDCVNKTAPLAQGITPYKMLRTTNIRNGKVDTLNVRYVSEETYIKWTARDKPCKGDLILTREAPLGEVALVEQDDTIFLGQRLVQYRADDRLLDKNFLFYVFSGPFMQEQIRQLGIGMTVKHLRVPDSKVLSFPLPPLPEQQRIVAKVANLLAHCAELEAELLRARQAAEALHATALREAFMEPAGVMAKVDL